MVLLGLLEIVAKFHSNCTHHHHHFYPSFLACILLVAFLQHSTLPFVAFFYKVQHHKISFHHFCLYLCGSFSSIVSFYMDLMELLYPTVFCVYYLSTSMQLSLLCTTFDALEKDSIVMLGISLIIFLSKDKTITSVTGRQFYLFFNNATIVNMNQQDGVFWCRYYEACNLRYCI